MNLTSEDKNKIKKVTYVEQLNLSSGSYYVKRIVLGEDAYPYGLALNEVIGMSLIKYFNIPGIVCPFYQIYMPKKENDEEIYVISEDLNRFGDFRLASFLGISYVKGASLYEIWVLLEKNWQNKKEWLAKLPSLFQNIIFMYLFDIFFNNWDRKNNNWGIIFNKDLQLAMFDNEYIFDLRKSPHISVDIDGAKYLERRKKEKIQNIILNELQTFIKESSTEFVEIMDLFLTKMTPNDFAHILDEIENNNYIITDEEKIKLEIDDREELQDSYEDNYMLIENIKREISHGRK